MKKKNKIISIYNIIIINLVKKSYRTLLMLFIVFLLSFSVFTSSFIVKSLSKGIKSTVTRINADIIVVPGEYEGNVKNSLFRGEPVTVNFEKNWVNKIKTVDGIKNVTPQLFLATLSKSCCDAAVQLIAFDPKTDFVIQPWINTNVAAGLSKYEVVVGNDLKYKVGDTAKFYGQKFRVVGKLEKTGMGYDQSAFISMETAYELSYTDIAKNYFNFTNQNDTVSTILVKVKDSNKIQETARKIRNTLSGEDILVYTTDEFVKDTQDSIANYSAFAAFLITLLIIMSLFTLISIFSITMNERQHEFGILASIGARKRQITFIIAGEALVISFIGSISGVLFARIVVYVMTGYLQVTLKLPFLHPTFLEQLIILGKCFILSIVSGGIASLIAAYRINYSQPYLMIKENE